jgi:hypothetical protein
MPYGWHTTHEALSPVWMPYTLMLDEFARELANIIMGRSDLSPDGQREARGGARICRCACDSVGEPALCHSLAVHLRDRAFMPPGEHDEGYAQWKDDLPMDQEINFAEADRYGAGWRGYRRLKACLEAVSSRTYQAATYNFRNLYNHRFSPRFVVGVTNFVSRIVDDSGDVSYAFGGLPPLDLGTVCTLLGEERDRCYAAFEAFQALVGEQERAIAACPTR